MTHESLARKLRILRATRGITLGEAEELTGVTRETIGALEHGQRGAYTSTLEKIAKGYGVTLSALLKDEDEELLQEPALAGGKAEAPPPLGLSERAALTDEGSLRLLAPIAPTAIALNAQFAPDVDANDFTIEEYEQVGEAFTRHDRQMADAMSKYSHSGVGASGAPEAVREAFNRAWVSMQELQYTLQRAYEKLVRREEAGVPDLDEFRRRTA